jgi:hypothetical protein
MSDQTSYTSVFTVPPAFSSTTVTASKQPSTSQPHDRLHNEPGRPCRSYHHDGPTQGAFATHRTSAQDCDAAEALEPQVHRSSNRCHTLSVQRLWHHSYVSLDLIPNVLDCPSSNVSRSALPVTNCPESV